MIKSLFFTLFISVLYTEIIEPIPVLKGVVLTENLLEETLNQEGFSAKGIEIPNGLEDLQKTLSSSFIGKPLTEDLICNLQKELSLYYKNQGASFTAILIPDQKVTNGVVQVEVRDSCIDDVTFSSNRWFSRKGLQRKVQLKKGDRLCCEKVMNDLAWLNRNPFICAQAIFCPGKDLYTTNVELKINDRIPFEVFVGADNTGTDFTGNARFFAGATWGNTFNRGDILSYQFSTTTDVNLFYAHFGQYLIFLPWKHSLNMYGGYSRTCPDIENFMSEGFFSQLSCRYTIPIKPLYKPPFHEFAVGVDYKNTNNNLNFIGDDNIPVISKKNINLLQFVGSYTLGFVRPCHEFSFNLELFWSPGQLLDHQSDSNFESLRAGAKANYVYGRALFSDIFALPRCFEGYVLFRGQVASIALLPSEQFGIGGYDTVRGYDEREFNGDDAFVMNLELRTPNFHFSGHRFFNKHRLFFLTFLDYGIGYDITKIEGQPSTENLLSIGLGARYFLCDRLSFRVDYGFKLLDTNLGGSSLGKFHLGGFITF